MSQGKTIIGVGQVGTRLADLYSTKNDVLLTFNTDSRDTGGIKLGNNKTITNGGAGQNYSKGLKIWSENRESLEKYLEPIVDKDVIYFVSGGGGSGSSSVITFLNILMKQNNRVLLVVSTPFLKESIPATSNATRLLSRVSEFSNNMSVLILQNDDISKEINSTSFEKINERIIQKVGTITDIAYYHNDNHFTPFAIDESDHTSVAFSGGFINISHTDLEEDLEEKGTYKIPKFSYGNVADSSNLLIVKSVPTKLNRETTMLEGDKLSEASMKVATRAKSARVIHGIIRTDIPFPKYSIIASGIDMEKIFSKLRDKATDSAIRHTEKVKSKSNKMLERSEDKILDV